MEEVYRNIVGIEEALRLQESSSLELARENLRLVNLSITLYTGLLREIDSRLASCPHRLRNHYQGEKNYLEAHIREHASASYPNNKPTTTEASQSGEH